MEYQLLEVAIDGNVAAYSTDRSTGFCLDVLFKANALLLIHLP